MRIKGRWTAAGVADFLADTRVPLRLACNTASGFPLLASLWFVAEETDGETDRETDRETDGGLELWCATQRDAHVASRLREDGRCAFEVSTEQPPYRGVRGSAVATLHDERGEEVLRRLLERYVGGSDAKIGRLLLERVETETALRIVPERLVSWDFTERMDESG